MIISTSEQAKILDNKIHKADKELWAHYRQCDNCGRGNYCTEGKLLQKELSDLKNERE
jgi:hypothetical protein